MPCWPLVGEIPGKLWGRQRGSGDLRQRVRSWPTDAGKARQKARTRSVVAISDGGDPVQILSWIIRGNSINGNQEILHVPPLMARGVGYIVSVDEFD